jgi:hypothetical protein
MPLNVLIKQSGARNPRAREFKNEIKRELAGERASRQQRVVGADTFSRPK